MDAFVQVVEVWTLRSGVMRLHSGSYGRHHEFAEASESASFEFGEGLPGSVWSSRKPQIWEPLGEDFVRLEEARAAGLDAGVGIPISAGGRETNAVVTLLCGSREKTGGCIERWDVSESGRELSHAGGYYGQLEAFARMSPLMRFPIGRGLPGMTLQSGLPTVIDDTRTSDTFLRGEVARESGVEAGLGIPIYRDGKVAHVVVLLSTESTPLARAFEVWVPAESDRLRLQQSFYARGLESFAEVSRNTRFRAGEGLPGMVYRTELPQVFGSLDAAPFVRHDAARAAGLQVGVGIPVSDGRNVRAVVVLLS